MWINLDYVVRVERGGGEEAATSVIFADSASFTLSPAEGKRLVEHLRPKKKKKKGVAAPDAEASETAGGEA